MIDKIFWITDDGIRLDIDKKNNTHAICVWNYILKKYGKTKINKSDYNNGDSFINHDFHVCGISGVECDVLKNNVSPIEYAIKELGWIRVWNNNIQMDSPSKKAVEFLKKIRGKYNLENKNIYREGVYTQNIGEEKL